MRITATFLALLPGMALAGGKNGGKCKKPLVSSQKLQSLVTIDDLLDGSKKLQEFAYANGGNRAFGGGGHNATVDWVYKTLKSLNYYNVVKQPFESIYSEASGTLTIGGEDIQMQPMTYTPAGDVSAPLVPVANLGCEVEDYPAEVAGKIALISRGSCTFSQKSQNAKAAGAVGALVYNNEEGLVQGTLGEALLDYAPIAGITRADGLALLEKLAEGEVVADLKIDATVENRITYNVIAETKGGDHENVLVVGAHSDSVPAGPGIK
jgi:Zn-dependent M28 family amino/carboxypeptidase